MERRSQLPSSTVEASLQENNEVMNEVPEIVSALVSHFKKFHPDVRIKIIREENDDAG